MDKLRSIYDKIKFELDEQTKKVDEKVEPSTKEDAQEREDGKKKDVFGVRRDTKTAISGLSKQLFQWKVEYEILKDVINDKVKGLTLNRRQTEEIFKIIKDMLENPQKYEEYK